MAHPSESVSDCSHRHKLGNLTLAPIRARYACMSRPYIRSAPKPTLPERRLGAGGKEEQPIMPEPSAHLVPTTQCTQMADAPVICGAEPDAADGHALGN